MGASYSGMRRKRLTERQTIDVLLAQGAMILCPCPRCSAWDAKEYYRIEKGADAIREHLHQLATGGKDNPANWQYWHTACSHRKTHGTKATSAGSDAHARAKIRRLRTVCPKHPLYQAKRAPRADCPDCRALWNRVKGPKRKIPSRPFQKRIKKP